MGMKIRGAVGVIIVTLLPLMFIFLLLRDGWFCDVDFVKEVSPVDIFNVFVTAVVAIWLGRYVTKKLTEQRFIKEFLIADISKIESGLDALKQLTSMDQVEVYAIFQSLRTIQTQIDILQKTTRAAELDSSEVEKLTGQYRRIYVITTDADGDTVNIVNKREEINTHYHNFIISLREIICQINKHS